MPYLIDGHNLIPEVGLRLDAIDDELELIAILQEYSRKSRRAVEVFFDGAPAGRSGSRKFGQVTAHFVTRRSTADAAIVGRLAQLGRAARNWTVVSSDRQVLAAAAAAHASVERSNVFAAGVRGAGALDSRQRAEHLRSRDGGLSDQELQQWLELFKKR